MLVCALQHCAGAAWRLVLTHPLLIVLVVTAVRLWQGHIGCTATGSFSLLFQWNELPEHSQSLPPLPLEPVSPVSFPPEHIHSVPVLLQLVPAWTAYCLRASLGFKELVWVWHWQMLISRERHWNIKIITRKKVILVNIYYTYTVGFKIKLCYYKWWDHQNSMNENNNNNNVEIIIKNI